MLTAEGIVKVLDFGLAKGLGAGGGDGSRGWYDVTHDGSRFLMACGVPAASPPAITVSMDWTASIK